MRSAQSEGTGGPIKMCLYTALSSPPSTMTHHSSIEAILNTLSRTQSVLGNYNFIIPQFPIKINCIQSLITTSVLRQCTRLFTKMQKLRQFNAQTVVGATNYDIT